ncbi:MAG: hypothetical protein V5A64_01120 [Candidatus Thermoplasmatota archaeon]
MVEKEENIMIQLGSMAFLVGIVISLLIGLYQTYTLEVADLNPFFGTDTGGIVAWLLAIIGAIVGFITIFGKGTVTREEVPGFLSAGIVLLVMYSVFRGVTLKPYLGSLLQSISFSLSLFVAPAVAILAIKAIWDIGKDV